MTAAERDPARYLVDGGVLIPAGAVAGDLFRLLVVALRDQVRAGGGGRVSDGVAAVAEALHAASLASDSGTGATGSGIVGDASRWRSADDAGREVGLTGRWVRHLCQAGVVDHHRLGPRTLMVDVESLRQYLRREAA